MAVNYADDLFSMQTQEPAGTPAPPVQRPADINYADDLFAEGRPTEDAPAPSPVQPPEYELETPTPLGIRGTIKEMWTGDKSREFDYPEIPIDVSISGKRGGLPAATIHDVMAYARGNDFAKAEIFNRYFPEASIEYDSKLNPYTDYFGENMYLNRPGASPADAVEAFHTFGSELASAVPAARLGKAVLGPAGAVVASGAALGGMSLVQDKIAEIMGSTQGNDWKRAKLMALFGAGGEAGGYLLSKMFNKVFSSKQYASNGSITDKGRAVLEKQGIDPDLISSEFIEEFNKLMKETTSPASAATAAEAAALPQRVPMSKGNITRDVSDQALEARAAAGAMGEEAKGTMQAFRQDQVDALQANRQTIQGAVGREEANIPSIAAAGEGMAPAMESMYKTRRALHGAMKSAYEAADARGMRVDSAGIRVIYDYINESLRSFPRGAVFDELADMRNVVKPPRGGARIKQVSIRELEFLRSRLSAITRGSDPVQAQAARKAVQALDEGREAAITQGLFTGDVEALRLYQRGAGTRRLMNKMFEEDRLVAQILDTDAGPYGKLILEPSEAANTIFTASALGGKKGATKALERIRTNLLAAGDERSWNLIREEAVWRLFRQIDSAEIGKDMTREFSGRKLAGAMDKVFRDQPELMDLLFTKGEQGLLKQFRNVAVRATQPVPGAVNTSNTAYESARILQMIFGPSARIIGDVFSTVSKNWYKPGQEARLLNEAVGRGGAQVLPPRRMLPPGYGAGLAGVGAGLEQSAQQRLTRRGRRRLQR